MSRANPAGSLRDRVTRWWPPIVSAVLLALAFPPFNLGLLVFAALVPWLLELRRPDVRSFRSGYLFGLVFGAAQLVWLAQFTGRWTGSAALGAVPWILCTLAFALYFGLAGWLIARCWRFGQAIWIPFIWAGVEVFRSYIPAFAFPWALTAEPLWRFPMLIQSAGFGMIFLVSAWVVAVNLIVARWMSGDGFVALRPLLIGVAVVLAASIVRLTTEPETELVPITVGQPGVDMAFGDPLTRDARLAAAVETVIARAGLQNTRMLVLPEGMTPPMPSFPPETPFRLDPEIPTLFGGQRGINPSHQTAFAYEGGAWSYADKTRLVIFGEYVPGRDWIPFLDRFNIPAGDIVAGRETRAVALSGISVGPVICFEALFPDIPFRQLRNGARLLAVMSIDDWYMGTSAPESLRSHAVWRAVETGLPLVRSASLGETMAIDGRGRILARAPLAQTVAMRVEVPVPKEPHVFLGLPAFPIFAFLSLFLAPALERLRRKGPQGS